MSDDSLELPEIDEEGILRESQSASRPSFQEWASTQGGTDAPIAEEEDDDISDGAEFSIQFPWDSEQEDFSTPSSSSHHEGAPAPSEESLTHTFEEDESDDDVNAIVFPYEEEDYYVGREDVYGDIPRPRAPVAPVGEENHPPASIYPDNENDADLATLSFADDEEEPPDDWIDDDDWGYDDEEPGDIIPDNSTPASGGEEEEYEALPEDRDSAHDESKKKSTQSGIDALLKKMQKNPLVLTCIGFYVRLSKVCAKVSGRVFGFLSSLPLVGRVFSPLKKPMDFLTQKLYLLLPVIITLLIAMFLPIAVSIPGSSSTSVKLPDDGKVRASWESVDKTSIELTLENDGDVIAYVVPEAEVVKRDAYNPITWFFPKKMGVCSGSSTPLDIDETKSAVLSCETPTRGIGVSVKVNLN